MDKYKIIYKNYSILGAYFYDNAFGLFFFSEKTDIDLEFSEYIGFNVKEETLEINDLNDYKSYKYKIDGYFIYVFAKLNNNINVKYNNFDLCDSVYFDILSKIFILPNGNYVCSNIQNYITAIEKIKNVSPDMETFFRGHYSYQYSLIPSLFRKKKYYDNEDRMYMDFKTQFYNELSNKKYIEILTTMQHYKMPTRLLDTTSNPLVALWMACEKPEEKLKGINIGEVKIMNAKRSDVKYSDSNTITLVSALSVLDVKYKQELYDKIIESIKLNDSSIYRNSMAYRRYYAEVSNELSYFDEDIFYPKILLTPKQVRVGMINDRIISQSGSFILFGLCDYQRGEQSELNTLSKERIFIVNKEYILKQLDMLNINRGTMYPDKDNTSVNIVKSYE